MRANRRVAMGHCIHGFVGHADALRGAAVALAGAKVAPLLLGYAFLPVGDSLVGHDEPAPFPHLVRLTSRLATWAAVASAGFPVAYIETDYFGGAGEQAAVVWVGGVIAFGPAATFTRWEGGRFVSPPLSDRAINRAVRLLGVDRDSEPDEFDALGLGRHRSDKDWLAEAVG